MKNKEDLRDLRNPNEDYPLKEMTEKDLEKGGEFYNQRYKLEEVAQNLEADSYEVVPASRETGPICVMRKKLFGKDTEVKMYWDDSTGLIKLIYKGKRMSFYQDEANFLIWRTLVS